MNEREPNGHREAEKPHTGARAPRSRELWSRVALCASLAFACVDPGEEHEAHPGQVGTLLGFTGESATGFNYEKAMQLLTEQVNAAGGIAGREFHATTKDTSSDLVQSIDQVQELVGRDDLVAILGPEDPRIARHVAAFLGSKDTLHVIAGALLPPPDLIEDSGAYTVGPNTQALTCALARQIESDEIERVVILHTDHVFQKYFAIGVENALVRRNGAAKENVEFIRLQIDESEDQVEWIAEARAFAPDAIVLAAEPLSGMRVVNTWSALAQSSQERWYLSPTFNQKYFLDNVPPWFVEGAVVVSPAFGTTSAFEEFRRVFSDRWSAEPFLSSGYYYDGLAIIALATEAATLEAGPQPTKEEIGRKIEEFVNPNGATLYAWNQVGLALEAIRRGESVHFEGVTGNLEIAGVRHMGTADNRASLWKIRGGQFVHERDDDCDE